MNFETSLIKPLIILIKIIQSLIKSPNLLILLILTLFFNVSSTRPQIIHPLVTLNNYVCLINLDYYLILLFLFLFF